MLIVMILQEIQTAKIPKHLKTIINNMTKKITLSLLVGIFIFAFSTSAIAQDKTKSTTEKEAVSIVKKQENAEQYNPRPQQIQNKASKNPIRVRTVEQEIIDLKFVIKNLEAKEEKIPFEVKRLAELQKQLVEKEKTVKK
jgi:cell division protein FtsL